MDHLAQRVKARPTTTVAMGPDRKVKPQSQNSSW
jgi:hypothetical protein